MPEHLADRRGALRRLRGRRPLQAWANLSLRAKLLLFALSLVTLPGGVFALIAFSGARAALEREIGIQLHQMAERGADAVGAALERAQSDARSWASQDIMRDLLVGDVDKRVSRFLKTVGENEGDYLEIVCVDRHGVVVAASSGARIGRNVNGWGAMGVLRQGAEALEGPMAVPEFEREVLEIGVPIPNPDAPGGQVGSVVLIFDWRAIQGLLDDIRIKLAGLGKRVAAIVVDRNGKVIGGTSFDGRAAQESDLAAARWGGLDSGWFATGAVHAAGSAVPPGVLVGAARIADPVRGWSVLVIERTREALAAVQKVRARWTVTLLCILLVGLMVAALLARQVMGPLEEVTRATSAIASHPDRGLPLLPVRSRDEVGQLTEAFNTMTVELKRSHDEALSAAKFAFAGELAAMVAHEVRTPLSVMRSSAQMLAEPAPRRSASNTELVDTIVAEVDRVERVVTGLIQLARPVEQRPEATPLRDVLARAREFAAVHAEKQRIRISCEFAEGDRQALCDSEQMYQVVLNLLVNALQALPPGGSIWLRTLSEDRDSGTVGFEVADDGPGLPAAIRDRVFQPFVTGREGGTGLGLAFVDRVVKAHRGSVSVRSEPGRGTVFAVRLPVAEVAG